MEWWRTAQEADLGPLLETEDEIPEIAISGPRRWWHCPLDTEGLAGSSVELALRAATILARQRKLSIRLGSSAELIAGSFDSLNHLRIDGGPARSFAPLTSYYRARDGWVRLHANYPHHQEAVIKAFNAETPSEVAEVIKTRTASYIESVLRDLGGVAAMVRSESQWRSHTQGSSVAKGTWLSVQRDEEQPGGAGLGQAKDLPMDGLRVLDLSRGVAGPTGTRLLASLGARVLRVDPPHLPELRAHHVDTGFGKYTATLDIREPAGLERLHGLISQSDAVVVGYRPGSLGKYDLDAKTMRARHPEVVTLHLSAWGDQGPWAVHRGFDSIIQASCGISDHCSYDSDEGRRPGALPVQAIDHAAAYLSAAMVMLLLAGRPEYGAGGARLSLARTAQTLLDAPRPDEVGAHCSKGDMPVHTEVHPSDYGILRYAACPVLHEGKILPFPFTPREYGRDPAVWPKR